MAGSEGQQHPLNIYFWIWGLLFVVSTFSYLVDYLQVQGMLRWTLIIFFMFVLSISVPRFCRHFVDFGMSFGIRFRAFGCHFGVKIFAFLGLKVTIFDQK